MAACMGLRTRYKNAWETNRQIIKGMKVLLNHPANIIGYDPSARYIHIVQARSTKMALRISSVTSMLVSSSSAIILATRLSFRNYFPLLRKSLVFSRFFIYIGAYYCRYNAIENSNCTRKKYLYIWIDTKILFNKIVLPYSQAPVVSSKHSVGKCDE